MDPSTDETRDMATAANTAVAPDARTTAQEEPEAEKATFTPEYVRRLRSEAAARRREVKEGEERITAMELEMRELREARLHRAVSDANATRRARLADVSDLWTFTDTADLVGEDGKPDPERIEAAIAELVQRKPHLAISPGSPTRGVMPGGPPVAPLGLGALVGRAARGESLDSR